MSAERSDRRKVAVDQQDHKSSVNHYEEQTTSMVKYEQSVFKPVVPAKGIEEKPPVESHEIKAPTFMNEEKTSIVENKEKGLIEKSEKKLPFEQAAKGTPAAEILDTKPKADTDGAKAVPEIVAAGKSGDVGKTPGNVGEKPKDSASDKTVSMN